MKSTTMTCSEKSSTNKIEMVDFYNEATEDYEYWSKDYNMHFGYFIPFKTNPFNRDSMLEEMNYQVVKRLKISKHKSILADLGCGMGGPMRHALKRHKNLSAIGITLSNFQVYQGNKLLQGLNGTILNEDYNHTSFRSNSFDAALAIESFCHSGHSSQSIREAYRILKSKGKLVIADAFLKKEESRLSYGSHFAYEKLCNHWSLERLETIDNMRLKLKRQGFNDITVENVSFKVAPSVLHVPFAIIGFIVKNLLKFKSLKRESLHNLLGSLYALLSGLHMKSFGYYIITATKSETKKY